MQRQMTLQLKSNYLSSSLAKNKERETVADFRVFLAPTFSHLPDFGFPYLLRNINEDWGALVG